MYEILEGVNIYSESLNLYSDGLLSSPIFPMLCDPFGCRYENWTIRWWRWLLATPREINPAMDITGARASINQNYAPVYFLCQTWENKCSVGVRKIVIPEGTSIFMPLINWISIMSVDGFSERDLKRKATQKMDIIEDLQININGKKIKAHFQDYRIQTGIFNVRLPNNNIFDLRPGLTKAYSDGYWIMTTPIARPISLYTFSSCSSGLTKISIQYQIGIIANSKVIKK